MPLEQTLTRKVGPIPMWGYGVAGAAGVGVWYWRKRQAAAAAGATSTTDSSTANGYGSSLGGDTSTTGGAYGDDGGTELQNEFGTISSDINANTSAINAIASKLPGSGPVAYPGGVPGGSPALHGVGVVKTPVIKTTPVKAKAPAKPKYYPTTKVNIPEKPGYGRVFNHTTGKWGYVKLSVLHPAKK